MGCDVKPIGANGTGTVNYRRWVADLQSYVFGVASGQLADMQ